MGAAWTAGVQMDDKPLEVPSKSALRASQDTGEHDWERLLELHALDFEWYFSLESSHKLADMCVGRDSILLLGVPTVAQTLSMVGRRDVTLVDSSPTLAYRLPEVAALDRYFQTDVGIFDARDYDTVLLDPPWYLRDTLHWIKRAACALRPGGQLQFVLFPDDIRPNARVERHTILEYARRLGVVQVAPSLLWYQTPTFERCAMSASGIPVDLSWRRGGWRLSADSRL